MTTSAVKVYHSQMKEVFGKVADQLARQTGFVQRQSPLTGSLFVQALVLSVYERGVLTLSEVAAGPALSRQPPSH